MERGGPLEVPPILVETDEFDDDWLEREVAVDWRTYIHQNPDILVGKPVIRGTRISAELMLELFAAGWSEGQVLESYPHLTSDEIRAVFALARACVRTTYPISREK